MKIEVGQKYRDNDPRMQGRILEVMDVPEIDGPGARVKLSDIHKTMGWTWILANRLHQDGKPRKTGFSLIR